MQTLCIFTFNLFHNLPEQLLTFMISLTLLVQSLKCTVVFVFEKCVKL